MRITLFDEETLACSFPYSVDAVGKIKSLPERTFDAAAKCWHVPVKDFDQVLNLFPDSTVHPDVWEIVYPTTAIRLRRAEQFCTNLNMLGVSLHPQEDGRIIAQGPGVSPVLQTEVDKFQAEIRLLLRDGHDFSVTRVARQRAQPQPTSEVTAVERGIVNAANRKQAEDRRRSKPAWLDQRRKVRTTP